MFDRCARAWRVYVAEITRLDNDCAELGLTRDGAFYRQRSAAALARYRAALDEIMP